MAKLATARETQKLAPRRIEECPEFAQAQARIEAIEKQRTALVAELDQLKAAVSAGRGQDSVAYRAKALLSGQWKPGQVSELGQRQKELEERTEDLAVLDKALEIVRQEMDGIRRRCGQLVRATLWPEYRQLLLAHIEAVLAAHRSAVTLLEMRESCPDVPLPYVEYAAVAGQAFGEESLADANHKINLWLAELVAQRFLSGDEPPLQQTASARR